jgi:hypothetical protein
MKSASAFPRPTSSQELFLRNMHFNGTIGGAFQRSGIYKAGVQADKRATFRQALRAELERLERAYCKKRVSAPQHVRNIESLCAWSAAFKPILKGGKLNFGIAQKLLNLHLKGLWCFGLVGHEPPHLPVDRIIQERLRIRPIRSWTKIQKAEHYMEVIDAAERIAREHGLSLSELELRVYNGTFELPF